MTHFQKRVLGMLLLSAPWAAVLALIARDRDIRPLLAGIGIATVIYGTFRLGIHLLDSGSKGDSTPMPPTA